ncbi:sugar nucleotide-binding protein [Schlesneria paludicola]|uniref:sugar nucleotide-binding protein n=1 Tax=Schlesneria paludicola TaxID=360056 RepID=UPI00029ADAFC|nr:sugar nucleotide-binding protein [Schlesneria paludicola]
MDQILVAGVNTVVGANLAEALSDHCPVVGVSFTSGVSLPTCNVETEIPRKASAVLELVRRIQPSRIVLCGIGADSCWDESRRPQAADVTYAKSWIDAAQSVGSHLTLISSDAVFTGPWMFHAENSHSICPSPEAELLRQIEAHASASSADALIVRTHAIGWQAGPNAGWLETLLADLERGTIGSVDFARHGTPMLATELADVLKKSWESGLVGLHHIAGAERISPREFATRLAAHFRLARPATPIAGSLVDRTVGFGCGETSLQTRKIRRALGIPLPLLDESLEKLYQQHLNGYREQLRGSQLASRVA